MLQVYDGATITPTTVENDWHLRNAYGNTFKDCVFVGSFSGINFTRATFGKLCDLSQAEFDLCNFTDINPLTSEGLDPQDPEISGGATRSTKADFPVYQGLGSPWPHRYSFATQKELGLVRPNSVRSIF